jgi:hypothetical protein
MKSISRSFAKEWRSLRWPWYLAAGAGVLSAILIPIRWFMDGSQQIHGSIPSIFINLLEFGFFAGIALLAATSFGAEFQQRTLPLLLTQPCKRGRLWNEKMLALGSAVGTAILLSSFVLVVADFILGKWEPFMFGENPFASTDALFAGMCILATVCSSSFWTFATRTTIGGLALNLASQLIIVGFVALLAEKFRGPDFDFQSRPGVALIVGTGLVYSLALLLLGKKLFARLELRETTYTEIGSPSDTVFGRKIWPTWLRVRQSGRMSNLVRKELRLQQPVLLFAAVLSICWLVILVILLAEPAHHAIYEGILNILTGLFVSVLPLLAACVPLSEEKTLGLMLWQLTLPVSAFKQWAVKLLVGLTTTSVLGLALPALLAWLTSSKASVGLAYLWLEADRSGGSATAIFVMFAVFAMGFWAATLLENVVWSVVMGMASFMALAGCMALGSYTAGSTGGLEAGVLTQIVVLFQLPPDVFSGWTDDQIIGWLLVIPSVILLVAIVQSFLQFRGAQGRRWLLVKSCVVLVAISFALSFWVTDLGASRRLLFDSPLTQELFGALNALPLHESDFTKNHSHEVTLRDLEARSILSSSTKRWLRNSSIRVTRSKMLDSKAKNRLYTAELTFPNGRNYSFTYPGPVQLAP